MAQNEPLVRVNDIKIYFPVKRTLAAQLSGQKKRWVHAVDGVSFDVEKGRTMGLVGESGCGKTTIGKALVRLFPLTSGSITIDGKDITKLSGQEAKALCKEVQYVFQDPYASLNPQMTVMQIVRRPLDIFDLYKPSERETRVLELLDMVGIAANQAYRYPHEFSGGQRQRISIARALAVEPQILVADEPTSALDVSIQCQILDLLEELKEKLNLTMLFISHDLSVVYHVSDDIAVMYLGHIVERGNAKEVLRNPMHPYSKALLEALPVRGGVRSVRNIRLQGSIPSAIDPPSGCQLHPRCPFASARCSEEAPQETEVSPGRFVSCHLVAEGKISFDSVSQGQKRLKDQILIP